MRMETPGQVINALAPGQSTRLLKIEYGGSLEARRLKSGGVTFYWRQTQQSKTVRWPIGPYDAIAPPKSLRPTGRGYSVAAAREAARDLAKRNADTPGGLRGEREREASGAASREKAQRERQRYTVKALCAEYCAWLKSRKRVSWREAEIIFGNHLLRPFPELAETSAGALSKRQVVEVVRAVAGAGKLATARKLRAYLRAAYSCAVKAESDASLPAAFMAFGVSANPVESTAAIKGSSSKNPLTIEELCLYWKVLATEGGTAGAALRIHLLSGAQRIAQLCRLKIEDVTREALQLLDPKGRRSEPRVHLVPVNSAIRRELAQLSSTGYVLSCDGGQTPIHPTTLSAWAADVGARAKLEGFQLKRVRSGVETALASRRVSLQTRGQLQSHGISGVQAKHYDAHEYLKEKLEALDVLHQVLKDGARLRKGQTKRAQHAPAHSRSRS